MITISCILVHRQNSSKTNVSVLKKVNEIIKNGVDPNTGLDILFKELDGKIKIPVLHYAVQTENYDITSKLIVSGANVNGVEMYGTTALHWAATTGNIDICKLLIKNNGIDKIYFNNIKANNIQIVFLFCV